MENKNKTDFYLSLLMVLCSNALVVYGVIFLGWNFFMVMYSYWFGELISSVFDTIKLKTVIRRHPELKIEDSKEWKARFFLLFLYWVFIVVVVGFVTAPRNVFGENIMVLLFMDRVFNMNLMFLVFSETFLYMKAFYYLENYDPKIIVKKSEAANKKTMIMHVSIIFGTFAWFAMNSDKFFFRIDAGEYGSFGFMMVFVFIRVLGDVVGIVQDYKRV